MLAVPGDLVRGLGVEHEAERPLALPHAARDVVPAAELVRDALTWPRTKDSGRNETKE